jgi:hypothetical protein
MPATFLSLQQDLFKQNTGGGQTLLLIPAVDNIVGKEGLAIYNQVSMQFGETIQYFMTFDDVIKFIHFGKGLGTLVVEGIMFSTCGGAVPGLVKFRNAFSALRGNAVKIELYGIVVAAVMTNAQVSIMSDPDTMGQFSFNFSIVNHVL